MTKGKRGGAHRQKRERRLLSGMMLRQDYHSIMGFRRSTASPTWWSCLDAIGELCSASWSKSRART